MCPVHECSAITSLKTRFAGTVADVCGRSIIRRAPIREAPVVTSVARMSQSFLPQRRAQAARDQRIQLKCDLLKVPGARNDLRFGEHEW